jgi:D-alanyl-D-alanine dipeptidase
MRSTILPRRAACGVLLLAVTAACATSGVRAGPSSAAAVAIGADAAPPPPPSRWMRLIGEYGPDSAITIVLERDGRLWTHTRSVEEALTERSDSVFDVAGGRAPLVFHTGADGGVSRLDEGTLALVRRQVGPASGNQLVITPVRPIDELRREALAAHPPVEKGPFLPSQLTELTSLDPTIRLEIRYATSNNLFGTPFYSQARAFLQRPAAEAVVRANASLRPLGYGLLVHDGYRPWYVTKMFWDASPEDKHVFVADPAKGSKHNRGAAVDLTLYELATGQPVDMVSTYDETSPRAYPDYPGGTSRQRWHRALLRRAMEAQGFTVYEAEWWHFDYKDWQRYPIGNVVFEDIPRQ